jgi:hypothetical protein
MIHEKYTNSSFWLSDDFLSDGVDVLTGVATKDNTTHLIRLAGYRRAIANFVRLVTKIYLLDSRKEVIHILMVSQLRLLLT